LKRCHSAAKLRQGLSRGLFVITAFSHLLPMKLAIVKDDGQSVRVTVAGKVDRLEVTFIVLATQNPIEQEGTYPLPEAQLDRFLFEIEIGYPTAEDERRIISQTTGNRRDSVQRVLNASTMILIQQVVRDVPAASNIIGYASRLVRSSRPGTPGAAQFVNENVRWGAGPRGGQALILGAKARALIEGRFAVGFEDVRAMAYPVLRHRILPNFRAEAEGISSSNVISEILRLTKEDGP